MYSQAAAAYIESLRVRRLSANTIRAYRDHLIRLGQHLGHDPLTATPEELAAWAAGLKRLRPESHRQEISRTRSFYRWALNEQMIAQDPSRRLPNLRVPRPVPRPIAEAALEMALRLAPPRIHPWLVLAAFAGLRATEIAHLEREDVLDTATPPVLIVRGKGGRQRVVPLNETVIHALRAHGMPRTGPVFLRYDGQPGPNHPWVISEKANEFLHSIGVPETLHQLRHRFGTVIYQQTQDLRLVQELLGHASPTTTAGYAAFSRARAIEAVRALDENGPNNPVGPRPSG